MKEAMEWWKDRLTQLEAIVDSVVVVVVVVPIGNGSGGVSWWSSRVLFGGPAAVVYRRG